MTPHSSVSSARFRALLTLCVCAALIVSGPAGHACTRVFWNDNSIAKVVGRTADWFEAETDPRAASDPKLLVLPRGLSKSGAMNGTEVVVTQNPAKWTSLYGSVVVANYNAYVMDGMNETGLAAHALALGVTKYGDRDVSRAGINMNLVVQYLLDNAATVAQALALLPQIQPVVVGIDGYATGLSFSIEDATGDSAVVEYIDGVAQISHGAGFCVTANTKLTEAKVLLDAYNFNFTNTTRSVPVPGNTSSVDRFIRASYYRGLLDHVAPRNALEARAAVMSVMRNVSDPIGAPGDVAGVVHETDWRTVYDLTSRAFVFENPRMLTTLTTDLRRLNFAAGTGVRIVDPLEPNLPDDITGRYQPTGLPVPAVGGAPLTDQGVISFSRLAQGETSIFSIRADGQGETRLTQAPPSRMDLHSTWSADGSWVAFTELSSDRSRIMTMRADGSARTNITADGAYYDLVPSISPDGSRIAYTSDRSGNYEVYTIAADGSDERRITHSDPLVTFVGPKYSPDGTKLLVAMRESTNTNQDLYILNADGTGTPQRLTTGVNNAEGRAWSPDGTRIVFNNMVNGVGQIFVINTNGTGLKQITTNSANTPPLDIGDFFPSIRGDVTPAWSPDGEWIAFASDRTGNFEVNIVRTNGSSLSQVTYTTNNELSLGWRPLPGLTVETAGYPVMANNDTNVFPATRSGSASAAQVYTLRNAGSTVISDIVVTKSGTDSSHFLLTAPATNSLAPGQTTAFSAIFSPSSAGEKNALLSITSNHTNNSPFNVNISGLGLGENADTDSDGLNDAAEFSMSALGFDWQSNQPTLVTTLYSNANVAQLFTQSQFNGNRTAGQQDVIANPMAFGLYDSNSIMDLRMGGLMLEKQGTDGIVVFQTQTTTDLATQPFTNNGTPITNTVPMPGNKGFLRIQAK
jgi:penicillin V acylase-like amidase (Ntn superfamily)/Tol biopolymer transport system component